MILEAIIAALVSSIVTLAYLSGVPYLKRVIQKRSETKNVKIRVPQNVAVLDVSNVALYGEKKREKGSIERVLVAIKTLQDRGFRVIAVSDASLRYKIDKPDKLEKLIELGKVIQAPSGTPADYFILSIAESEYGIVVSNDSFKDWRDYFPWIKDKRRVVRYLVIDGKMYLYPDVRPKKKWKGKEKRVREVCIDLSEEQEEYVNNYVM